MGAFTMKFLLTVLVLVSVAVYSEAICCPWTMTSDVKCACDDGGLVHPWECCSTGACNIFCCNCGGPCRTNKTLAFEDSLPLEMVEELNEATRSKRSIDDVDTYFNPEEFNAALHFNAVDANDDLKI